MMAAVAISGGRSRSLAETARAGGPDKGSQTRTGPYLPCRTLTGMTLAESRIAALDGPAG